MNDAESYVVKNSAHMEHTVDEDDKEDNASNQDCDFVIIDLGSYAVDIPESHLSEENEDNHQKRDFCVKVSLACA